MTFTKKTIPTLNFIVVIVIYIFFASMTLFNYLQIRKSLSDYSPVSGTVENVEIINLTPDKATKTNVIVISLRNSKTRFGFQDKHKNYYERLEKINLKGKSVTIYYNPMGSNVSDNLTLWVGQLEIEHEIFFPLSADKDYESTGLKIQLSFLSVFTLFMCFIIYKYIKDKRPVDTVI